MRRTIGLILGVCACSGSPPEGGDPLPEAARKEPKMPSGVLDPLLQEMDAGDPIHPQLPIPPRPNFGTTVELQDPPPAASGGTLAVNADGTVAVAADPDRDLIYVVDLTQMSITATIPLVPHDEPGRVVIDESGRAHVALRRG